MKHNFKLVLSVLYIFIDFISNGLCYEAQANLFNEHNMHPSLPHLSSNLLRQKRSINVDFNQEKTAYFWNIGAQIKLRDHLLKEPNKNIAKNVIFFLGDGMSIPTLAASRAYLGQLQGNTGEESRLYFEDFPYVGLSKTYCVDKQVADSACTATAYLTGVKANYKTIGLTAAVDLNDCVQSTNRRFHTSSIAEWAQRAGKATGIVTTTRVTHASPAGTYAHTANRDWECDTDMIDSKQNPKLCQDIASQLIYNSPGKLFNVILGGGRSKFLPNNVTDEEGVKGLRKDGKNLINDWQQMKKNSGKYVFDRRGLHSINISETEFLLGLFEGDHMQYNLDANPLTEPTLKEMTDAAIRLVEKNPKGYFLFIEGGRIDHAHHDTKAKKALDETVQFAEAIRHATETTSRENTLIIVTADHAHTMSIAGYSNRGNNILGINSEVSDMDKMPYSTLSYANGPGFKYHINETREHLIAIDLENKNYQYPSTVPLTSETHGGDDVAVFAHGPWSHLFTGLYEQNVIPHILAYASCIGEGLTACKRFT